MNQLIRQFKDRYQVYTFPAVTVLGIMLVSLYVLIPRLQSIPETQNKISQAKEQLTRLQKKRLLLDSLDRNSVLRNVEDTLAALPSEVDVASILYYIEQLGTRSGSNIAAISFTPGLVSSASATKPVGSEVLSRNGVSAIPITLRIQSTDTQLMDLLKLLSRSRRLVDMDSLSVAYAQDGQGLLSSSLSLFIYYLPQITQIGKLDSPVAELTQAEKTLLGDLSNFPILSVLPSTPSTSSGIPSNTVGKYDLFNL